MVLGGFWGLFTYRRIFGHLPQTGAFRKSVEQKSKTHSKLHLTQIFGMLTNSSTYRLHCVETSGFQNPWCGL